MSRRGGFPKPHSQWRWGAQLGMTLPTNSQLPTEDLRNSFPKFIPWRDLAPDLRRSPTSCSSMTTEPVFTRNKAPWGSER